MAIPVTCQVCGTSFDVPIERAEKAVQCPTCNEAMRAPAAPPPDDEPDVAVSGARSSSKKAKSKKDRPYLLKFRVFDDPAAQWFGVFKADLTSDGLVMMNAGPGRKGDVVVPFGVPAEAVAEGYLRVEVEGRVVTFTLVLPGYDHIRLMRDLAEVLRGERQGLRLDDYRLPRVFPLLALLPAIVPVATLFAFVYGNQRVEDWQAFLVQHWPILSWSTLCLIATGLLFAWTRSGSPSVTARMVFACLFAVSCNCVPVGVFAWRSVDWRKFVPDIDPGPSPPIAEDKWAPFDDPDKKFRIDMPGTPKASEQLNAGIATSSYMVDLKHAAFIATRFTIPAHEFDRIPLEQRFAGARDGMLKKTPGSRLGSEKDIVFDGSPGKEYVLNMSKYDRMVVRLIAVENHVYMVMAGGRHYTPDTPDVKRFLDSLRITRSIPAAAESIPAATDFKGLVGYWSFDENDAKEARDYSGKGRHAAIEGAVRVVGKRRKGMRFDGKSMLKVQTDDKLEFGPDQKLTVAGWFNAREPKGTFLLLRNMDDKDKYAWIGSWIDGSVAVEIPHPDAPDKNDKDKKDYKDKKDDKKAKDKGILVTTNQRTSDGRWHHFAAVFHGTVDIYIDGKRAHQSHEGRFERRFTVDQITMGSNFEGNLDEICIFERVLTADEILALAGRKANGEEKD